MSEEPLPRQHQVVSVERVIGLLQNGDIFEDHGRIRWSSNYTSIVSVKDAELETLAVYKPRRGERPLWDFPEGTLCCREVAAYHVSDALGWDLVAPTILRQGPRGIGSLQLFIEHDPEINYFSLSDAFVPQLKRMAVFDVIVNNADRKGGHCLVDPRGKLWGIDHGICFHVQPKLRTVIWDFAGEPVDSDLLADIQCLLEDVHLLQRLQGLLSKTEIEAVKARIIHLLDCKIFPQPESSWGPNYPWPPI